MAAGDVNVTIVDAPFSDTTIAAALAALRVTAGVNGKYLMTTSAEQIILAAITEA